MLFGQKIKYGSFLKAQRQLNCSDRPEYQVNYLQRQGIGRQDNGRITGSHVLPVDVRAPIGAAQSRHRARFSGEPLSSAYTLQVPITERT